MADFAGRAGAGLERLKWLLWHGNTFRAGQLLSWLEDDLYVDDEAEDPSAVQVKLARYLGEFAAGTQAMAAGALAIERGVTAEQIVAAAGLALHAAAFSGMPDPVLHLAARAMGVVTGLAAPGPGPRAPGAGVLLDAAPQAGAGLQQLLAFRHDCTTVTTPAEQAAAGLTSAAAGLGKAAGALHGLIELAGMTGRSGRTGKTDLS